jgi:alkylhydroperoxidase/carboxymuconolactone decarboxylase family protein YurZ
MAAASVWPILGLKISHQQRESMSMNANVMKYREQSLDNFNLRRDLLPEVAAVFEEPPGEIYKEGALSGKTKRLMALCGALVCGCPVSQLSQVEQALALGASQDEIIETFMVAISLGGMMAASETTNVVQFLREQGKI